MATLALEDPPTSLKSIVWEPFAFPINYHQHWKETAVDKTKTVCWLLY